MAVRRRTVLAGGAALVGGLWAAQRGWARAVTTPVVPDAPAGVERVERVTSAARGRVVDLYTAVPDGYGTGRGLPVCLVLHGGSKAPRDFAGLGFGRFLTDSVRRGNAPFVLAAAAGDRLGWRPHHGDDPQRMVHQELPRWCAARGFDAGRVAAWGWSMGGAGALLLAETFPGSVRAVAAFAPAVRPGDAVFGGAGRLAGTPVGLWCGRDDALYDDVRDLEAALPERPAVTGYGDGDHNMAYWTTVIPAAFDLVARALSPAARRAARGG